MHDGRAAPTSAFPIRVRAGRWDAVNAGDPPIVWPRGRDTGGGWWRDQRFGVHG